MKHVKYIRRTQTEVEERQALLQRRHGVSFLIVITYKSKPKAYINTNNLKWTENVSKWLYCTVGPHMHDGPKNEP